jgi:methylmalonyl-CoA/ethylmalonyl-CoA epimerase
LVAENGQLDHVAILVRDIDEALVYWRDRLGLPVVHDELNDVAQARLTYLDAGSVFIQLLAPTGDDSPLAQTLATQGEGLHHLCFAADDVLGRARELADAGAPAPRAGSGRGRPSAFVPGPPHHGVLVEATASDAAA